MTTKLILAAEAATDVVISSSSSSSSSSGSGSGSGSSSSSGGSGGGSSSSSSSSSGSSGSGVGSSSGNGGSGSSSGGGSSSSSSGGSGSSCSCSCSCCTVQRHVSSKIGTANHSDVQKIRIIEFFYESRLHWQFEVGKNSTTSCFRLHICLRTNKTLIHNPLYIFDNWGANI